VRRSTLVFLAVAALVAALCVRLGVWQLGRLGERRAANALVRSRLDSAAVPPERLPGDTAAVRYRRVVLRGTYDFAREVVLAGRSRNGSPGVNILTPLRLPGRDTAVLVNRGWVYSPDAAQVDAARWREPAEAAVEGFVNTYQDPSTGPAVAGTAARTIRRLDPAAIDSLVSYPLAPYYVVATSAAADSAAAPVRLAPPPLDEGSHASYAFQWFAFATIALGGAGALAWQRRQGR
jgi:surfeit locus 1 family protein